MRTRTDGGNSVIVSSCTSCASSLCLADTAWAALDAPSFLSIDSIFPEAELDALFRSATIIACSFWGDSS
jgi:hypothetical protein